jgi:hypothetical protein
LHNDNYISQPGSKFEDGDRANSSDIAAVVNASKGMRVFIMRKWMKDLRALIILVAACIGLPVFAFAASPIGSLERVNQSGEVSGWGLDPDTSSQSITINLYVDGPLGEGTFIGATTANVARVDVNRVTGVSGDHGFLWQLPAGYAGTPRQLYAYAVDTSGNGIATVLPGSPFPLSGRTSSATENTILGAFNVSPAVMVGAKSVSGAFKNSPITITTADAFAGAIFSLTWKGKQFLNSFDHGRELQSASSFDGLGECFNPTEAGSSDDAHNSMSTSKLVSLSALGNVLQTRTQMAFWLKPNESSYSNCGSVQRGANATALSSHFLDKIVTVGFQGMPNVIEHKVTFHVAEPHANGLFEALTGYMPESFSKFWSYDPVAKTLAPLSDGPAEQDLPVILATADGSYAMGVYSPDEPQAPGLGYGRYKFGGAGATTKWNCIFRETNLTIRDYTYRCYSIIGSLNDVRDSMNRLFLYFRGTPSLPSVPN